MFRQLLRSSLSRHLTVALVVGQVLASVPVAAQSPAPSRRVKPATPPSPLPPAAPEAPKVMVNRKVPKVAPPAGELTLRDAPSMADIVNARVFREPLVPVGGVPTHAENAALGRALLKFAKGEEAGSDVALRRFLVDFPESAWRASLLLNLGTRYRSLNAYSRALASWDEAWTLAGTATDSNGKAVADLAKAEWLLLNAGLGQVKVVQDALQEIKARPFNGLAAAKLGQARELAGMISAHPEKVIPSGTQALLAILQQRGQLESPALAAYQANRRGDFAAAVARPREDRPARHADRRP